MFEFDYTSIFLILLNVFVFVLFLLLIVMLFKSYRTHAMEEEEVVKSKAFNKAQALLDEAQKKSLEIISDSTQKSKEIINNVEYLTDDAKNSLQGEFDKVSNDQFSKMKSLTDELLETYTAVINEEKDKGVEVLKNVSKSIEGEALKELGDFKQVSENIERQAEGELENFRKALQDETVKSEQMVQERVNQEFEDMKSRIKGYEDAKMKKIDESINGVLAEVAREVFGTSLDLSTSEELVMNALDRAKKEGMFA